MNRIEQKVKDVVDVRKHGTVSDFSLDPINTIASYHFTDATAELMAKWISRVCGLTDASGSANALAGFRGVGKSHFLGTFGWLLANADMRPRVQDRLVEGALQRLQRKSFPVLFVRRGTCETLLDELKAAIATFLNIRATQLSGTVGELLAAIRRSHTEGRVVILIDTAFERASRVTRDDGAILAEIAEVAKNTGSFVGVALDDDISGADGANIGVSSAFSIDYLDQEHLYRIVDTHIFPKDPRMRGILHDIYGQYRAAIPGFRWSEQRFTALYPLHPVIMEIAPFVRLYLREFALLGFASEAGSRILGRPANSLIAPDEVFDSVETNLREVDDLKDVFASFDRINAGVIAKTAVMKRLQAKLVLKGLFLLSLNEGAATASEIAASMLILDDSGPDAAVAEVERLLTEFRSVDPGMIDESTDSTGSRKFSFKLMGKDDLRSALAAASESISYDDVLEILRQAMCERFSDCAFEGHEGTERSETSILWRGSHRKGVVYWNSAIPETTDAVADWIVAIDIGKQGSGAVFGENGAIRWLPADIDAEAMDSLKRLVVLQKDQNVRTEFSQHLSSAIQAHALAAEKIFQKAFLNEATLEIDGLEYNFTDEARNAATLAQVMAFMLESLFEGRYPVHPYFPQPLGMNEVSALVSGLYGGSNPDLAETQALARSFGSALGIVEPDGDRLKPASAEALQKNTFAAAIVESVSSDGTVRPLGPIFADLSRTPMGLGQESVYLLLAALVSAGTIEFITRSGDRINKRSLDLQIIWEDISGIAAPKALAYSPARLVWWAGNLCGRKFTGTLDDPALREEILSGLSDWLAEWDSTATASRFDELSDDQITSRIWRLSGPAFRPFMRAADAVRSVVAGSSTIEACLETVADTFSDSDVEFESNTANLKMLTDFVASAELREEALRYLSLAEFAGDSRVDALHSRLHAAVLTSLEPNSSVTAAKLRLDIDNFRKQYAEVYAEQHDRVVRDRAYKEKFDEIFGTGIWREFEAISGLDGFEPAQRSSIRAFAAKAKRLNCALDSKKAAESYSLCGCGFALFDLSTAEHWPEQLWEAVNQGVSTFRSKLTENSVLLIDALEGSSEPAITKGASKVISTLKNAQRFGTFAEEDINALHFAFRAIEEAKAQAMAADAAELSADKDFS
ncbi:MAG: hypothetical protein IT172_00705 [Acidobacteria bacterium]|nr:hypothetical protein [Acidobacteriota bacterium]